MPASVRTRHYRHDKKHDAADAVLRSLNVTRRDASCTLVLICDTYHWLTARRAEGARVCAIDSAPPPPRVTHRGAPLPPRRARAAQRRRTKARVAIVRAAARTLAPGIKALAALSKRQPPLQHRRVLHGGADYWRSGLLELQRPPQERHSPRHARSLIGHSSHASKGTCKAAVAGAHLSHAPWTEGRSRCGAAQARCARFARSKLRKCISAPAWAMMSRAACNALRLCLALVFGTLCHRGVGERTQLERDVAYADFLIASPAVRSCSNGARKRGLFSSNTARAPCARVSRLTPDSVPRWTRTA